MKTRSAIAIVGPSIALVALAAVARAGPVPLSPASGGPPAGSNLVTWVFEGEITRVSDPNDFFEGALQPGPFSGSLTYDLTTPDSRPADPTRGFYEDAITSVALQVGPLEFVGPVASVPEQNNLIGVEPDRLFLSAGLELGDANIALRWSLFGVVAPDALPPSFPDLALFQQDFNAFSERLPFQGFLEGTVTRLVPEPSTLLLLLMGAMYVLHMRRCT